MADFNFFLNRQGIQGPQGPKGDQGFSPVIEVDTDTASEYKLKIITETGEFVTDNLRGDSVTDLGGTYVRFNQETKTMSAANPDFATDVLYGVVRLANDEDIEYGTTDRVVTADRILTINSTLTTMQTEIDEISQDIPDISGLATKAELEAVEAEIPDVSGLATKIELSTAVTSLTQADTALDNRITQVVNMMPTVNDGQLTITQGGSTLGVFTANQSGNVTIDLPASSAPNNGTLTINVNGTSAGAFSANQAGDTTVNITTATQLSDLTDGTTVVTQSTFTTEVTALSQDIGGVEARVNLIEENGLTTNDITQTISSTGTTQVTSSAAVYNALQSITTAPTNMVTTDTAQTITGTKTFRSSGNAIILQNPAAASSAALRFIQTRSEGGSPVYCPVIYRELGVGDLYNSSLIIDYADVLFKAGGTNNTVSLLPSSILSDSTTTTTSTWTSDKINSEVASKSGVVIKRYTEVSE